MALKTGLRLLAVLLLAVIVMVVRQYGIASYRISTDAMEEALHKGDFILVNKLTIKGNPGRNRVVLFTSPLLKDTATQPLFVSRLIGMPGDTIRVDNHGFSVNGLQIPRSPRTVSRYIVKQNIQPTFLAAMDTLKIPVRNRKAELGGISLDLTAFEVYQLKEELPYSDKELFQQESTESYRLIVPQKGRAYRLDANSLRACREAILAETHGKAVIKDDKLFLDGKETTFFFFNQNYYWVLSDNTNNGIDSRHLGFIPANHMIGHALFCWFSIQPQRIFKPIR